jgi:2',3'-cyclic-nucleotide 2'-phosphodiesterase (5'-nucleotidase family)
VGHALVIQASSFTRAFDQVHLLMDKTAGTIAYTWASVVPAWKNTTPLTYDPAAPAVRPYGPVQHIVNVAVRETNPITQQVINHASADIPSQREDPVAFAGIDSPAGDLVADSQRNYTGKQLAFVNTGSIRAGLLAGPVTYGNLFTMQPFQDDYVDTFRFTGAQVWALLRQQLAPGTGGIMQISGLRFTYSGTQITAVTQSDGTPIPDDASKTYTGTANSFMMGGGDGFTVLTGASDIVQTADSELVPLVSYVGTLPNPFTYGTDGRIAIG